MLSNPKEGFGQFEWVSAILNIVTPLTKLGMSAYNYFGQGSPTGQFMMNWQPSVALQSAIIQSQEPQVIPVQQTVTPTTTGNVIEQAQVLAGGSTNLVLIGLGGAILLTLLKKRK